MAGGVHWNETNWPKGYGAMIGTTPGGSWQSVYPNHEYDLIMLPHTFHDPFNLRATESPISGRAIRVQKTGLYIIHAEFDLMTDIHPDDTRRNIAAGFTINSSFQFGEAVPNNTTSTLTITSAPRYQAGHTHTMNSDQGSRNGRGHFTAFRTLSPGDHVTLLFGMEGDYPSEPRVKELRFMVSLLG